MSYTREDWVRTLRSPGGVATAMQQSWLTEGCPICGCKYWELTSDSHAYCECCSTGMATDYSFTLGGEMISYLTPEGNFVHEEFLAKYGEKLKAFKEEYEAKRAKKAKKPQKEEKLHMLDEYTRKITGKEVIFRCGTMTLKKNGTKDPTKVTCGSCCRSMGVHYYEEWKEKNGKLPKESN